MKTKPYVFRNQTVKEKTALFFDKKLKFAHPVAFNKVCDVRMPTGATAIKPYYVGGRRLFYCTDKKVYEQTAYGVLQLSDAIFTAAPDIIEITFGGEKKLLLVSDDKSVIEGKDVTERNVPRGDCYAVYKGMLFSAKGRTLRFSAPFDFTEFSVGLKLGGYFETDEASGEIVYMCELDGRLCLLCKNGLVFISADGERTDYSAEKAYTGYIDALKNSGVKIGEQLYFVSDGMLARYGKTLKLYTLPKEAHISSAETARTVNGFYLLPFSDGAGRLLCARSGDEAHAFVADAQSGISASGAAYLCENGCRINDAKNALYKVSLDEKTCIHYVKTDLDKCALKRVVGICVHNANGATLNVKGDFGEKTFTIGKECKRTFCDLSSYLYEFTLSGASEDAQLIVKYLITGGR